MNGESWLHIDEELVHFWDYFASEGSALTNTELLFRGAARPHVNFFISHLTHAVFSPEANFRSAKDEAWQHTLQDAQKKE